ncbi:tetratricopeptide repeat protein [Azospirillum sp. TSO22-1]|uniref:tetratricopeptide repeat protein n=1 Tax=Azospirillum sp. TSO22-1 TaxID=716789 RepID=UPI000D6508B2|nr:tetratricopeptide repeat protein [Azospirillum sp. TSO22-1]
MKVFISYSHKDSRFRDSLDAHLAPLRRMRGLDVWTDRKILAGEVIDDEVKRQLTTADVIVLLISQHFYASDYCYCTELKEAMRRHDSGEACVIPVIVRPVDNWYADIFGKLKAFPEDGRPINNWRNRDEAYAQVAAGIRRHMDALEIQFKAKREARADTLGAALNNLPWPENPYFQDPHGILDCIAEALIKDGTTAVTHGMGGVGKTQAALHYAHRNQDKYRVVWWAEAETEAGLDLAYTELAKALRLPEAAARDTAEIRAAVRNWLERESDWLLILDNAEDMPSLSRHLPRCPAGHVIITSRSPEWDRFAKPLPLDRWPVPESADFLLARVGQGNRAEAEALARDLDGLPLALEQAAAYVKASGIGFAAYRHLFQERFTALAGRSPPRDYPAPLLTTWNVSLQAAERACAAAGDLMRLLAVFAPDDIPRSLFLEHGSELAPPLDALADQLMFNDAVAALQRYSLIRATEDALFVHRLVQRVARSGSEDNAQWTNAAIRLTNAAFPHESNDVRTWSHCARLRPHAEALLAGLKDSTAEARSATRLLNQLGVYLRARAEFSAAHACYERALRIDESTHAPDHPTIAIRVNNLGAVLREQGDLDGARACFERALRIDEAAYGPDHPEVATDVNNLGDVLQEQGDLDGARACYERALRIDESTHAPDHPNVAIRVNNLGTVLREQGDLDGARACLERALCIDEAAYGPDHPNVANDVNNLGAVLQEQGDLDGARTCLERALRIGEAAYGPDHPDVANQVYNLGAVLAAQGLINDAHACLERALRILLAFFGSNHPNTELVQRNLEMLKRQLPTTKQP